MSEPFLGQVELFAGNFAPRNWAFCNGQLLPIAQNTALFSLLGTTYGGDGRTSFGLPDLRGRAIVGEGQGPGLSRYRLGQKGGVENVALNVNQIPAHAHNVAVGAATLGAQTTLANQQSPAGGTLAPAAIQGMGGLMMYSDQAPDTAIEGAEVNVPDLANAGSGQTHTNVQPYLAMSYIIALFGLYPSRN